MNNDGIAFGDGLESMREVDTVILRFSVYMLSFPLSGEPIRKENPSVRFADSSALRCPKNAAHICSLAFFDRCGNSGFAFSATGSAKPQFPFQGSL